MDSSHVDDAGGHAALEEGEHRLGQRDVAQIVHLKRLSSGNANAVATRRHRYCGQTRHGGGNGMRHCNGNPHKVSAAA